MHRILGKLVREDACSSESDKVSFVGGSNFAAAYNFQELQGSSCTTAAITVDHSSYWAPRECSLAVEVVWMVANWVASIELYWIVDPANPSTTSYLQLSELKSMRFVAMAG